MPSRQFWIIVAGVLIVFAVYYPFSPGVRQSRNMKLAAEHIPLLEPQLAADPRFGQIELHPFTGELGSLMVRGELPTQADIDDLRALVQRSNPPCPVAFRVRIMPTTGPVTGSE